MLEGTLHKALDGGFLMLPPAAILLGVSKSGNPFHPTILYHVPAWNCHMYEVKGLHGEAQPGFGGAALKVHVEGKWWLFGATPVSRQTHIISLPIRFDYRFCFTHANDVF